MNGWVGWVIGSRWSGFGWKFQLHWHWRVIWGRHVYCWLYGCCWIVLRYRGIFCTDRCDMWCRWIWCGHWGQILCSCWRGQSIWWSSWNVLSTKFTWPMGWWCWRIHVTLAAAEVARYLIILQWIHYYYLLDFYGEAICGGNGIVGIWMIVYNDAIGASGVIVYRSNKGALSNIMRRRKGEVCGRKVCLPTCLGWDSTGNTCSNGKVDKF